MPSSLGSPELKRLLSQQPSENGYFCVGIFTFQISFQGKKNDLQMQNPSDSCPYKRSLQSKCPCCGISVLEYLLLPIALCIGLECRKVGQSFHLPVLHQSSIGQIPTLIRQHLM